MREIKVILNLAGTNCSIHFIQSYMFHEHYNDTLYMDMLKSSSLNVNQKLCKCAN